jgi:CrcB protein
MQILYIFLAGGMGCAARFLVSGAAKSWAGPFPAGTLLVNVLGSFLIGLLMVSLAGRFAQNPVLQTALITGFLGGFTTFSAFSYETVVLFQSHPGMAILNIAANVLLCLGATAAGMWVGKSI